MKSHNPTVAIGPAIVDPPTPLLLGRLMRAHPSSSSDRAHGCTHCKMVSDLAENLSEIKSEVCIIKGQLISEENFGVLESPKKQTKSLEGFLP